jgi:hypothetical protein
MNLALAIAEAHSKNEQTLANSIAAPRPQLESDALVCVRVDLRIGARAAASRSVQRSRLRRRPISGTRTKKARTSSASLETVRAIEHMHDAAGLSNPCATMAVRHELGCIYHIDAPRSWPKADRPLFNSLPIEVRAIIERRAEQDSNAVRRAQNLAAELRKSLNSNQKDVDSNVTPDPTRS